MSSPRPTGLRPRAVNLLLLVPLIVLVTPLFNAARPSLGGLPFFYWFQMAVIPVGIVCTVTVHLLTRSTDEEGHDEDPAPVDTDGETGARS